MHIIFHQIIITRKQYFHFISILEKKKKLTDSIGRFLKWQTYRKAQSSSTTCAR